MSLDQLYVALQEKKEVVKQSNTIDAKLQELKNSIQVPSQNDRNLVKARFIPKGTWHIDEPICFANDYVLEPKRARQRCMTFNRGPKRFIYFWKKNVLAEIKYIGGKAGAVKCDKIQLEATEISSMIRLFRTHSATRRIQRYVRAKFGFNRFIGK